MALGLMSPAAVPKIARAARISKPAAEVTAYDLILAMNSLRMANGLPALIEDPIINAVAQSTAQTMAASQMSWHMGNVSGRIAAAGYGGGATVWATENFAVGNQSIDEIMVVWSDADHMLPAVIAAYCHVGAGTATASNGRVYYILQAAYTSGKSCGPYAPPGGGNTPPQPGSTSAPSGISQYIAPMKIATADADGKVFHVVQSGQSFWSIAIAYQITIRDLKTWNNLGEEAVLKAGQKLFIPGKNTAGYSTPTRTGGIQIATPDESGRVTHVVQAYQTLSTISQAYGTTVQTLLALNGLQADWPLRIGQEVLVTAGNLTPSATLHPLQMLTPAADGLYYHTIQSGETLLWIAGLYDVPVTDLMAWNGLSASSVIIAGRKLFLRVTPPLTVTPTSAPPTLIPSATPPPTPTPYTPTPEPMPEPAAKGGSASLLWVGLILLLAIVTGIIMVRWRR